MRDYDAIKDSRAFLDASFTAGEVYGLPPGYISGFNITVENNLITIQGGIANVAGQQVRNNLFTTTINWLVPRKNSTNYWLYIDNSGNFVMDSLEFVYNADWQANYHPNREYRYIARFYIDADGDIREVDPVVLEEGENIFIGSGAGQTIVDDPVTNTGNWNIGMGTDVLTSDTTGSYNIAMGYQTLFNLTTGAYNIAKGFQSGYGLTTESYNIFFGYRAGYAPNINGSQYNIGIGSESLYSITTGSYNIAMGYQSLYNNTTGDRNIGIGYLALYSNTSVGENIAIGMRALYSNTSGYSNIGIGYNALYLSTGIVNLGIGNNALYNGGGSNNLALGDSSLYSKTTGSYNTALGHGALNRNITGQYNMAIGYLAGSYETGSYKLFIDALDRTNEATARVESMIYGEFNSTISSQNLFLNGNVIINEGGYDTDLRIESNNNAYMFFIDGGNDRIGIKTNAPQSILHLNEATSVAVQLQFTNSTTGVTASDGFVIGLNADEEAVLWLYENDNMRFATNNTERMRLIAGAYELQLYGTTFSIHQSTSDTSDTNAIKICGGGSTTSPSNRGGFVELYGNEHATLPGLLALGSGNVVGGEIQFYTGGNLRHVMDKDGNVGIGTTPVTDAILDVALSGANNAVRFYRTDASPIGISATSNAIQIRSNSATEDNVLWFRQNTAGQDWAIWQDTANNMLKINYEANVCLTIDSSRNVGIGTSTIDTKLHVWAGSAGTVTANAVCNLTVENSGNTGLQFLSPNTGIQYILFGDADDNDVGYIAYVHSTNTMSFRTNASGTAGLTIDSSGNIAIANGYLKTGGASQTVDAGGIAIDHGTSDGYAFSMENGDVAHGGALGLATNTYFAIKKYWNDGGGVLLDCATDGGETAGYSAFRLRAALRDTAATGNTDRGIIDLNAYQHDGAGALSAVADAGVMWSLSNNGTVAFSIKGNGDIVKLHSLTGREETNQYSVATPTENEVFDELASDALYDSGRSVIATGYIEHDGKFIIVAWMTRTSESNISIYGYDVTAGSGGYVNIVNGNADTVDSVFLVY